MSEVEEHSRMEHGVTYGEICRLLDAIAQEGWVVQESVEIAKLVNRQAISSQTRLTLTLIRKSGGNKP